METIYTRVKARILDLYPESAGRWTDTFLTPVMQVVDGIVRERAELSWSEQTITPVAGALYYALNSSAIWVGAVLFSLDGSNFKDGELTQTTFAELDEADPRWQDKTANEPRHTTASVSAGGA